jgi:hypothetical protein
MKNPQQTTARDEALSQMAAYLIQRVLEMTRLNDVFEISYGKHRAELKVMLKAPAPHFVSLVPRDTRR